MLPPGNPLDADRSESRAEPKTSASQADEALSALSHELRTPLAAIAGFAELLQARDDERIRAEATTRILEASEQLSAAIERLLQAIAAQEHLAIRLADPEERK